MLNIWVMVTINTNPNIHHADSSLTHWGRDKMAAIFQTTFSNAFSWMKMVKFRLSYHGSLFPMVQLTIFQHWLRLWLGADQATGHYLNQWWLVYWRIYASLGLNELSSLGTAMIHTISKNPYWVWDDLWKLYHCLQNTLTSAKGYFYLRLGIN